ncbi:metabolite traffic protein EboE [Amycolatopsis regifaucium]|uniref:Xylose isomerase n=1 Tax=Amycolatopsis regifaucium TaxID=546365 RepID=A0A154MRL1_9PSEU|nr:metabolite traffic protein EboE [Amycolatopsis regifaucium]KZB86938.1 xylose isomerase [Amycolatopsis regifaucium]OKA09368.1 xylose isomerase [Amycolatopsis regifaucium]SFH59449.1 Xylose isomerase-like TIM barrel [Amycolatopsis regifaucium]
MISYCTNVHPAEDVDGIVAQLERYALPVRERLGADRLGVGLWLSAPVARGLADDADARKAFRAELDARGLSVYTLNAFPYGGFHDEIVKHAVYRPEWTNSDRVAYTIDCVTVLSDLLADDASYGSISTLPLAWREPWSEHDDRRAAEAFGEVVRAIGDRPVKLAVEPEPGCVLDTVADALSWLSGRVDPEYVGLCLDTCHLAVSFADPAGTLAAIAKSDVDIVKVQASAALHVEKPAEAREALAAFAEPRYLHQVRELSGGVVHKADDLPEAWTELPGEGPWRVHFHLPLHQAPAAPLATTTDVLRTVAAGLPGEPHIEVETYTWSVLPDAGDLVGGIAAELEWAQANLVTEGVSA